MQDLTRLFVLLTWTCALVVLISAENTALQCHSCSGNYCKWLFPDYTGKCKAKDNGKCFIRLDPNKLMYYGCASSKQWPGLDMEVNGCKEYYRYGWDSKSTIWCLCDSELCNKNMTEIVNQNPTANTAEILARIAEADVFVPGPSPTQATPTLITETRPTDSDIRATPVTQSPPQVNQAPAAASAPVLPQTERVLQLPDQQRRPNPRRSRRPSIITERRRAPVAKEQTAELTDEERGRQSLMNLLSRIHSVHSVEIEPTDDVRHTQSDVTARVNNDVFVEEEEDEDDGFINLAQEDEEEDDVEVLLTLDRQAPREIIPLQDFESNDPPRGQAEGKESRNQIAVSKTPEEPNPFQREEPQQPQEPITNQESTQPFRSWDNQGRSQSGRGQEKRGQQQTARNNNNFIPRVRDCRVSNGYCEHLCEMGWNGLGPCKCFPGYKLASDYMSCLDINECTEDNGGCSGVCINRPGSFECACSAGYKLGGENSTTCEEIDECTEGIAQCGHECQNLPGSYQCLCPQGFELDNDGKTCTDINECLSGLARCADQCDNTLGSFSCECRQGYALNADGWTCDDNDECVTENGGCAQECLNSPGSYQCGCTNGFDMLGDLHSCVDVNECMAANGGCDHKCKNAAGSYSCDCEIGFALNPDGSTCDETVLGEKCFRNNGGCEQTCLTINASAVLCQCERGYQVMEDGKHCQDTNECRLEEPVCEHECTNTAGSYQCSCNNGYSVDADQMHCNDIDECAEENGGCQEDCVNNAGSYVCSCPFGFLLQGNGKDCVDINECSYSNGGCQGECNNVAGSFSCGCNQGYGLNSDSVTCDDIDECGTENGGCNHACLNSEGSYRCLCDAGYAYGSDNKTCIDYNECTTDNGRCEQNCENTLGSFTCSCNEGFNVNFDQKSCDDINECYDGSHTCAEGCVNTPGSYDCACKQGYTVSEDGVSCEDLDECEQEDRGGCDQLCINTIGSRYCACASNLYALASDGTSCTPKCPAGFEIAPGIDTCFRIYTNNIARSFMAAEKFCRNLNPHAHLVTVNTEEKRDFFSRKLAAVYQMLQGWQGWWTSGKYWPNIGEFVWMTNFDVIPKAGNLWGTQKTPFNDTCVWILQETAFGHALGNEDCTTPSGFICEVILPSRERPGRL